MRALVLFLAMMAVLAGQAALAGEAVTLKGRPVNIQNFPQTGTVCMVFESDQKKTYLICDDVTSKELLEELFRYGKKDATCQVEGTVVRKQGEAVYLAVSRVREAS